MSSGSFRASRRIRGHDPYLPGEQPILPGSVIKLNTNENPYPPSPQVEKAIASEVERLNLYPNPPACDLRHTVARLHDLEPNQIIFGNGSDDLLNLCIRCFSDDELSVGMMHPSYSLYEVLARVQGSEMIQVPFADDRFSLNLEAIASCGSNLFFLTSPHAPSGRVYRLAELRRLAATFSGLLVIDEAYADFAPETALPLLEEFDHLLITRTLSKSYSLAGLRVGYAIGHPKVIKQLDMVREVYNLDRLAQAGAQAALNDREHFQECLSKIIEQREWLSEQFHSIGWRTLPSGANFVFVRPETADKKFGPSVASSLFHHLATDKILVRYFPKHPLTESYLRISIGKQQEMVMLMNSVKQWTSKDQR